MTYWKMSAPLPVREKPARAHRVAAAPPASADLTKLVSALDALPNDGDGLDYDRWRNVVFAIHHATGGSDEGLQLAHAFSSRSAKYDADFLDRRVWPSIRSDRDTVITANTIYALAVEAGWEDPTLADGFEVLPDEPTPAPAGPKKRHRLTPEQIAEFYSKPGPTWLVKDVLPAVGASVVYGASGSGKSFLAIDIGFAVARGEDWRGKAVKQGPVLYVAAEGASGLRRRLRAYVQEHELDGAAVPMKVMPGAPDLTDRKAALEVVELARAAGPFALIVVDTLARAAVGADENSATEMGVVIDHAIAIGRATGAAVLLVHHSGKDGSKGARGSSAIKAALEAEIEVVRADRDRSATVTKMRDGEDGASFGFRLRTVALGKDEEGEPVTSCVVEHVSGSVAADKRRAAPGGRTKKLALAAVRELVGLAGEAAPEDAVLAGVVGQMVGGDTRDNRRNAKRALTGLVEDGFVALQDGKYTPREAQ